MAVFGVLVAIAAVQTSRNAPEANASRASLIEQIQARRDNVAALQERLERLRTSTTDLRAVLAQAERGRAGAGRAHRPAGSAHRPRGPSPGRACASPWTTPPTAT